MSTIALDRPALNAPRTGGMTGEERLVRRARTGEQARLLHVVDPDHRDARLVHGTAHYSRHPQLYGRRATWRLGMANPVSVVGDPARRLAVDSLKLNESPLFRRIGRRRANNRAGRSRKLSANGAIAKSRSPRCWARPRAKPSSGMAGSSTRCFSHPDFESARGRQRNHRNLAGVIAAAVKEHGYPASADPDVINYPMTVLLLTILVVYVTMVYGPIAAWLVELFPTRIRYSGVSLRPTISVMAGLAASYRPPHSPSSRPRARSIRDCGIRWRSQR